MEENDITTHVVAVTGIVKKGDEYLLARRSFNDLQAGGQWSFPGGKLDDEIGKDIIENALKREIMEEVGLEIEDHIEFIYNDGFVRISGHHVIMMTFLCYYKSGEAQPLEDQEEIRWLTLSEMVKMKDELPGYTWQRIEALIEHGKKIN
ncbi:MAG: NUDIX domain-containing protein [Candidatus Shapirobacteria bacterium]|nr:NUDIX domain-containing protein [Candidatus Shapirobacteria bacterium]MDD4382606.1 NUDIX domain-containing protein [Candidatus Shapirobacteria bacterium]